MDPPPPIFSSGVSVISSYEFYEAARAHLTPGGIMMQWLPEGATLDEFKAHLRTFHAVYPYMMVVFGPGHYGQYLLGSRQPMAFDPAAMRAVLSRPGVVADLSSAFDSPQHSLAGWAAYIPTLVWIRDEQVTQFTGTGPFVTDDRPLPEYFLLGRLFGPPAPPALPPLLKSLTPAP